MKKFLSLFFLFFATTLAACTPMQEESNSQNDIILDTSDDDMVDVVDEEMEEDMNTLEEPSPVLTGGDELEEVLTPGAHSEVFDTIFEYMQLIADNSTNGPYQTSEPADMLMIKDITLEGTGHGNVELWGPSDYKTKDPAAMQIFYIKRTTYIPGETEGTTVWFGPFQGSLGSLVQQAHEDSRFYSNN